MDGYCENSRELFEFDGCMFPACDKCSLNWNLDGSLHKFNPINRRRNEDIRRNTREKVEKVKEAGCCIQNMQKCEGEEICENVSFHLKKLSMECEKESFLSLYLSIHKHQNIWKTNTMISLWSLKTSKSLMKDSGWKSWVFKMTQKILNQFSFR